MFTNENNENAFLYSLLIVHYMYSLTGEAYYRSCIFYCLYKAFLCLFPLDINIVLSCTEPSTVVEPLF
jgi:hypothetical protein